MKSSGSKRIAERYVKALFEGAGDVRAHVEKDLNVLADALKGSEELRALLANPLLTRDQQGKAMAAAIAPLNVNKITQQFIALLARQKRLDVLPEIIALFGEWMEQTRGEIKASITSATALTAADSQQIAGALSKGVGKKVLLTTHEDPALLGGVVVQIGSLQLDGSLSGKLDRLATKLKTA